MVTPTKEGGGVDGWTEAMNCDWHIHIGMLVVYAIIHQTDSLLKSPFWSPHSWDTEELTKFESFSRSNIPRP